MNKKKQQLQITTNVQIKKKEKKTFEFRSLKKKEIRFAPTLTRVSSSDVSRGALSTPRVSRL